MTPWPESPLDATLKIALSPPTRVFLNDGGLHGSSFKTSVRECGGCGLATTDLLNCRSVLAGHPTAHRLAETNDATAPWACSSMGTTPILCPKQPTGRSAEGSTCWISTWAAPSTRWWLISVRSRTHRATGGADFGGGSRPGSGHGKVASGRDDDHLTGQIGPNAESVGIAAIAIHGRTTEMKFGQVRLEGIGRVVEAVDIPVLGNGDIESPEDAEHMMRTTDAMASCSLVRPPVTGCHESTNFWNEEDPGNWTTMAC